ncbi:LysR family transcriptional regulator [Rubrimonas cliftonensis]|uniref:DNA-binding transcriptional regulator, LysR family n=1 Tax=Rubrimonas cliftonensis TaxID=89524 RepID=A0A1H4BR20_9RHOB|nr:LysR family transcriptional regulator [Rubrimonas cliftonensis]SEA50517.1 DNA-binding transcriptional regulator, LysR family [Rubrimonas cliftonensis]
MNYAQIRAFYHVAREGGVVRAARVLNISQPAISHHIKGLEKQVRRPLFEKKGRNLVLSDAGRDLLSVTERLISAAYAIDDMLSERRDRVEGSLAIISDSPSLGADLLVRFARAYPDVRLSLATGSNAAVAGAVREGRADAGVLVQPTVGDDIVAVPLRTERFAVAFSKEHRFGAQGSVQLRQLADEALIVREAGSRTRMIVENALAKAEITPRSIVEVEGRDTIREVVARGMGVSIFATGECPPDIRLKYAPLRHSETGLVFHEHLIHQRARRNSPVLAALLAIAREIATEFP